MKVLRVFFFVLLVRWIGQLWKNNSVIPVTMSTFKANNCNDTVSASPSVLHSHTLMAAWQPRQTAEKEAICLPRLLINPAQPRTAEVGLRDFKQ